MERSNGKSKFREKKEMEWKYIEDMEEEIERGESRQ